VIYQNTVKGNDTNLNTSNPRNVKCPGALPFLQMDCGEGINLNGAFNTSVGANLIENNAGGILLSDEYGKTYHNLIRNNAVQNNILDCGITLASHPHSMVGGPGPGYGVYNNRVVLNSSTGNGGAGVGIFAPTPGTKAYNNTISKNLLSGNGLAGAAIHSHTANQNLNGNKINGNWVGLNNLYGDSDAGNRQTTGILVWSSASHVKGLQIENNTVLGGNHFGIWVSGPIQVKFSGNHINATIPIHRHIT
jgi:hypothetical protein